MANVDRDPVHRDPRYHLKSGGIWTPKGEIPAQGFDNYRSLGHLAVEEAINNMEELGDIDENEVSEARQRLWSERIDQLENPRER